MDFYPFLGDQHESSDVSLVPMRRMTYI